MKIAVSSYSYNQYLSTGKMTQLDALREAARQGFDGIEFTDLRPNNNKAASVEEQITFAKELREEADKLGIEIVAYLVGASLYKGNKDADEAEVERLCRQLDVAKALGVKIFRHDVCSSEKVNGKTVPFDRMIPTIAQNVRLVTEYARTLGIRTCSENHGKVAQDSDRVEKLFNTVANDNYGLLVDIGNFACVDENSITAVSRLAPYAIHVHAKDFHFIPFDRPQIPNEKSFATRGQNRLIGCALGDGDIPVHQCLSILKAAGYDGYVTIEFEGPKECLTQIELGHKRLEKYLK